MPGVAARIVGVPGPPSRAAGPTWLLASSASAPGPPIAGSLAAPADGDAVVPDLLPSSPVREPRWRKPPIDPSELAEDVNVFIFRFTSSRSEDVFPGVRDQSGPNRNQPVPFFFPK